MKQVDKDPSRVKTHVEDPAYHVPEPVLVISGSSPEWHQLFMANWLGIRKFWIKRLKEDTAFQHPSSQQWQDCVWPGSHGEMKWKGSLPWQKKDLGFTDAVLCNWSVFNTFCVVLSAWPGAHPRLYMFATAGDKDVIQQAAYEILSSILLFYA